MAQIPDSMSTDLLFQIPAGGAESRDGDEIFDAVMTTANAYFAGDKPLEQAADDIAKRLKIYNAEHS